MSFVKMGQGDCCVMTTPAGRIVVVDCGSDSKEEMNDFYNPRVRDVLNGPKFMRGSTTIDVLILTHADTDHYNQLKTMFGKTVVVQSAYHSDLRAKYATEKTANWLVRRSVHEDAVKQVTNNDSLHGPRVIALDGVAVPAASPTVTVKRQDGAGGIRILDEPNCKISLLAGGVAWNTQGDGDNGKNRGSLVTLIEVFGKKVLLCGDSTRSTEDFLMRNHAARIRRVDLAHVGHHGSNRTSSMATYVQRVEPRVAVISAGLQVFKDHLPSKAVVDRYLGSLGRGAAIPKHDLYYWDCNRDEDDEDDPGLRYEYDTSETTRPLHITGSWGTFEYTILHH
jgi:beta-lactamase superfamily II metal-dependent hydrolase